VLDPGQDDDLVGGHAGQVSPLAADRQRLADLKTEDEPVEPVTTRPRDDSVS